MTPPTDDNRAPYVRLPRLAASELGNAAYRLLAVLASLQHGDSREVLASNVEIGEALGCGPGNVRALLPQIEAAGWIARETRGNARFIILHPSMGKGGES